MKTCIRTGVLFLLLGACLAYAQEFPKVEQGNIEPNDAKLGKPINKSKAGELTIASLNVRNLGTRGRTLADYEAIVDLVDEADVVVFQEVGLGLFDKDPSTSEKEARRLKCVVALLRVILGEGWTVLKGPHESGSGAGAETSILAYREAAGGFSISGVWARWVDLGDSRGMAVWTLTLTKGTQKPTITLGSVHLTPDDPERGKEMKAAASWLTRNTRQSAIVCGDFNWGYKKTSGIENYKGEAEIERLHSDGKLFQLFRELSYLGKAKGAQLRTNMGYRKGAFFYDQFLTTPDLASKLADGGAFLEDCGVIAFGTRSKYMKGVRKKLKEGNEKGLKEFRKHFPKDETLTTAQKNQLDTANEKADKKTTSLSDNNATWRISDHRVIWMQLKLFP